MEVLLTWPRSALGKRSDQSEKQAILQGFGNLLGGTWSERL